MSQALYRKYRSKSLDEIVGQDHITTILSRAIKAGRVSHAYLLTGPRGVGKTSVARILAYEINGLPYDEDATNLDIIEIDAASNNGVEDVRDLREKVQIAPVSAAKKVYIIDEVHMLSKAAFNALLKTLEEPPEHVVFILATTDVEKLPATIISRTQRFSFRAISPDDAVKQLKHIAKSEKIAVSDDALALIASRGDGSFRDSISLLDQLASLADTKEGITAELVETTLGLAPLQLVDDLLTKVESHDITGLVELLNQAIHDGIGAVTLTQQLTQTIRTLASEKPQLLSLLDALLDVSRSGQPDLKLLSVLGSATVAKQSPKTAALATPILEISATVDELKNLPAEDPSDSKQESSANSSVVDPKATAAPDFTSLKRENQGAKGGFTTDEVHDAIVPETDFNWDNFLGYMKTKHAAIASVLVKCDYALTDNDLTIYARNAFYKKKLDDVKYLALLSEALQTLGSSALTIHTVPTAPPPTSSQAAAVAAIMGGGEEVSLA